jgi:hypothetical protein
MNDRQIKNVKDKLLYCNVLRALEVVPQLAEKYNNWCFLAQTRKVTEERRGTRLVSKAPKPNKYSKYVGIIWGLVKNTIYLP